MSARRSLRAEWGNRTSDVRQKSLIFRELGDETLNGAANHRVLAHQDDRLPSERMADFVHLLGADIVHCDNEDGFVFFEQALELLEIRRFGPRFAPHDFFGLKLGYLRATGIGRIGGGGGGGGISLEPSPHFVIHCVRNSSEQCQDR